MSFLRIMRLQADGTLRVAVLEDGAVKSISSGLPANGIGDAPEPAGRHTAWLIVPGHEVSLREVNLPPGAEAKVAVTLPYMLEDEVATPIEDTHFAIGRVIGDGSRIAGFTSQERMASWLSVVEPLGLSVEAIIPDTLALPTYKTPDDKDRGVIVRESAVFLVHLPWRLPFSVQPELLGQILNVEGRERPAFDIDVYGDAIDVTQIARALPSARITRHQPLTEEPWFSAAFQRLDAGIDLNLRQGAYAPRRNYALEMKPLRRVAGLTVACLSLWLLYLAAAGIRYGIEADRAYAKASDIAKEVMPAGTRLVNARAQLKAYAESQRGGSSDAFMRLSELLAANMAEAPNSALESLRFDRAQNSLTVSIVTASFDQVEKIKTGLAAQGGLISAGEARQSEGVIVSELTVRLP